MVVSKVISANACPMKELGNEFPCLATYLVPVLLDCPYFPVLLAVAPETFIKLGYAYLPTFCLPDTAPRPWAQNFPVRLLRHRYSFYTVRR